MLASVWNPTRIRRRSRRSCHPRVDDDGPTCGRSWLVVAIGDSTPAGFGVGAASAYPQAYADLLADEFGIEVEVANHATGQTRTVRDWVEIIETDEHLIADLAGARVVLIWM